MVKSLRRDQFAKTSHFSKMATWVKSGFIIDGLISCFAVSVKGFSAMDKGHVTQNKTYHSNWACFYGTMVAIAADFP